MLARVLLRIYLVEALLYGGACVLLHKLLHWPAWALVIFVPCAFVAVRFYLLLVMYRAAWRFRMVRLPEQQLTWGESLAMFFREARALFAVYTWLHPFEYWINPYRAFRGPAGDVIPVLFVHGFFCNGGFWRPTIDVLRKRGLDHLYTMNLDTPKVGIPKHAEALAAKVEELCEATGAEKVILVGHSMGGVVARTYVQRLDGERRVHHIISLGSPHHGTCFAKRALAPDGREMAIGHPWLNALNREVPKDVPITSIYSVHDNIVAPQDSSELAGADNIALVGIGHLEMAFHPAVQDLLQATLIKSRDTAA